MKQIFTAATVDEAKNKAAVEFGTEVEKITFTVLEEPKKGFFGKIKGEAKVEAEYEPETKVETVTEKTEAGEEKGEGQEEGQVMKSRQRQSGATLCRKRLTVQRNIYSML